MRPSVATFSTVGAIATVRTRSLQQVAPGRTARIAEMIKPPGAPGLRYLRRAGQRVPLTRQNVSHDSITGRGSGLSDDAVEAQVSGCGIDHLRAYERPGDSAGSSSVHTQVRAAFYHSRRDADLRQPQENWRTSLTPQHQWVRHARAGERTGSE
jgi:hypothetical protein